MPLARRCCFISAKRTVLYFSCMAITVTVIFACRTRRLESAAFTDISQTQVLLRDRNGDFWTRHVVAVMGFNHLSPRAAAGYSRLEFVRADRNPRDPKDGDAQLLRRPARNLEELQFSDGRLGLLQQFSTGMSNGHRPYLLAGSHDLYFVGCLIKQTSSASLSNRISVSRLPPTSGLGLPNSPSDRVQIPITEARWIWELIPSINPSDFANQYGTRRFLGFNERMVNIDYAGKESVRRMLSSYLGYESFARLSLSQPNPAEDIMVNSEIQKAKDGSNDFVCRILLGPVDTYENYITFGLEELIRDEKMIADLEAIDFRYANGPELFARASGSWLGKNWLTMGSFGLTGLTYFASGNTIAAVPIFMQRMSETAGLTNSAMVTASSVISEGLQARNARLEQERLRRREMLRLVIPESVRPLALTEGVNTALQMAAVHSYAGRIASLLHEDSKRPSDLRFWPLTGLVDAGGQSFPDELIASYVRSYDGAAAAYQAMERGKNPDLAQRDWEIVNQAVTRFAEVYPAASNAFMNQVLVSKINSVAIGSDTSLETFENLLGMQIAEDSHKKKLIYSYKNENIFNTYRQLQARSRKGTILSNEHVFMMTGPHPLRVESPAVQRKIASYRTLLMKLLGGAELDSHQERAESRQLFASISDLGSSNDESLAELQSLYWKDRVETISLVKEILNLQKNLDSDSANSSSCDEDSRDCSEFADIASIAKIYSRALESLDAVSQLSNRMGSCSVRFQKIICTTLNDILTDHPARYAEIKDACTKLSDRSKGRVACTRVATLEAFEVIEDKCLVQGMSAPQCLNWLRDNLVISGEEGYWPAGGGFGYQVSDMLGELERMRKLEGARISTMDMKRLEQLRIYFSK